VGEEREEGKGGRKGGRSVSSLRRNLEREKTHLDSCFQGLYFHSRRLVETVLFHVDDLACVTVDTETRLAGSVLSLR
jgi:hypothetical protein